MMVMFGGDVGSGGGGGQMISRTALNDSETKKREILPLDFIYRT